MVTRAMEITEKTFNLVQFKVELSPILTQGQAADHGNDVPGGVDISDELLGHIPVVEHVIEVLELLSRALGHTAMKNGVAERRIKVMCVK